MRNLLIATILFSYGCVPDFKAGKGLYKKIQTADLELEWFGYSSAWMDSPDYITLKTNQGFDTLCRASNITDINLFNDTITVYSLGPLTLHGESIKISAPKNIVVKIDSNRENRMKAKKVFYLDNQTN